MQKLLDNFIILNAFLEVLAIALPASVAYDTLVAADERSKAEGTAMCIKCQKHLAKSKKPTKLERFSREESSQRAPPFFCG